MAQHRVSTRRRHRESDVVVLVIDICLERKIFKYGDSKAKAERTPSVFSFTFMLHQIAYTWRMERGINTNLINSDVHLTWDVLLTSKGYWGF